MLVGTAGSGKTEIFKILTEALTILDEKAGGMKWQRSILNPKAITNGQMYGVKDDVSQE